MRIGFVSFWFSRGQAFVTREIKRVYDEAGHETHVLVRPDKIFGRYRDDGIWKAPHLSIASRWAIPADELSTWAEKRRLEIVFFFQNEELDAISALRSQGITTVGTFMWEMLRADRIPRLRGAFDCVYSLHPAQVAHMARHGVLTSRVHWGCWPELADWQRTAKPETAPIRFFYPAGYLEKRRLVRQTVKAFVRARLDNARLVVKSIRPVPDHHRVAHPQVEYLCRDLERSEHLSLLSDCDVVLANTRWEGLGLVFHEAIAMGIPVIAPDYPPMSDHVRHGLTGLLVPCRTRHRAPSGIPAADVATRALVKAIRRIAHRRVIDEYAQNTFELRNLDYNWQRTRGDLLRLLEFAGRARS